jgi:hypothetical protein
MALSRAHIPLPANTLQGSSRHEKEVRQCRAPSQQPPLTPLSRARARACPARSFFRRAYCCERLAQFQKYTFALQWKDNIADKCVFPPAPLCGRLFCTHFSPPCYGPSAAAAAACHPQGARPRAIEQGGRLFELMPLDAHTRLTVAVRDGFSPVFGTDWRAWQAVEEAQHHSARGQDHQHPLHCPRKTCVRDDVWLRRACERLKRACIHVQKAPPCETPAKHCARGRAAVCVVAAACVRAFTPAHTCREDDTDKRRQYGAPHSNR